MNKLYLLLILLFGVQVTFAQRVNVVNSSLSDAYEVNLISSSEEEVVVDFSMGSFTMNDVVTPRGMSVVLKCEEMMLVVDAGQPAVPSFPVRVMIGDNADMRVKVLSSEYTDYNNVELAPFKGDFPRTVNPDDVPYTYGEAYDNDTFFPAEIVTINDSYIHCDVRGQNMIVTPFSYNPQTKTLRVYHHIVMSMYKVGETDKNVKSRRSSTIKLDPEMKKMYENRYINYGQSVAKYAVLEEEGDMLVICHDDFMNAMQPFVTWKNSIGRRTTIVPTSVTGNTNDAIKEYITTQYQDNDNLTYILFVGDENHIPGKYMEHDIQSGKSDYWYGQIEGDDYYNELFVGRFSAETEEHVTIQVNKTIEYERDLDASATWLSVGQGVSKLEGLGGGHYGEADCQHIDYIIEDLLDYNYTVAYYDYEGVSGITSSAEIISEHINDGVGLINYCNHGSETGWGVFSYNNNYVNSLTNDNKLPFIISVACLNGKYDHDTPCFAETWLRATNDVTGEPTGAVGGMFSYISQAWQPPQYAQDEMIDILVESYNDNIKRTAGGITLNGNMMILDIYGCDHKYAGLYNTWIFFGDPSIMLRTAAPVEMTVTHDNTVANDATSFVVDADNADGALATLSCNNVILGSAVVNNGIADIALISPITCGHATLTVMGYNKVTYIASVDVEGVSDDCVAPENLMGEYYVTPEMSGALLSWNKAQSEVELTEFRVYRSADGVDYDMIQSLVNVPGMNEYQYFDSSVEMGTYYYKVSAYYNNTQCESDFALSAINPDNDYVIIEVTSVGENAEMLSIYPNPASSALNVKATGMRQYAIYNMLGNVVCSQDVDEDEIVIDMSNFESGIYVLQLMTESGVMTRRLSVVK